MYSHTQKNISYLWLLHKIMMLLLYFSSYYFVEPDSLRLKNNFGRKESEGNKMLFDDLPAAKKGSTKPETKDEAAAVPAHPLNGSMSSDVPPFSSSNVLHNQNQKLVEGASEPLAVDKKPKSLVESVGKAGTTMAFIPAALRKRKGASGGASGSSSQYQTRRGNAGAGLTLTPHIRPKAKGLSASTSVSIHVTNNETKDEELYSNIHSTKTSQNRSTESCEENEEYKEPQSLTDLHSSVKPSEMYDPMQPNDYLAYRQRKESQLLQAKLQRQVQKTVEMQKKLRCQIEDERRKALESGNVDKIIESRAPKGVGVGNDLAATAMGRGRGRGRGLSNLPAWLVKKQQEEAQFSAKFE